MKDKLRRKYGPVIQEVFLPLFQYLDQQHPLFPQKEALLKELQEVYATEYVGTY